MNVKAFFYSLNKKEREEIIALVKEIMLLNGPDTATLTPTLPWAHVYRKFMSTRLKNVFVNNKARLHGTHLEAITEQFFRSLRRAGPKAWYEFTCLREDYLQRQKIEDERSQNIR